MHCQHLPSLGHCSSTAHPPAIFRKALLGFDRCQCQKPSAWVAITAKGAQKLWSNIINDVHHHSIKHVGVNNHVLRCNKSNNHSTAISSVSVGLTLTRPEGNCSNQLIASDKWNQLRCEVHMDVVMVVSTVIHHCLMSKQREALFPLWGCVDHIVSFRFMGTDALFSWLVAMWATNEHNNPFPWE